MGAVVDLVDQHELDRQLTVAITDLGFDGIQCRCGVLLKDCTSIDIEKCDGPDFQIAWHIGDQQITCDTAPGNVAALARSNLSQAGIQFVDRGLAQRQRTGAQQAVACQGRQILEAAVRRHAADHWHRALGNVAIEQRHGSAGQSTYAAHACAS